MGLGCDNRRDSIVKTCIKMVEAEKTRQAIGEQQ
jgi:hypothetical protein